MSASLEHGEVDHRPVEIGDEEAPAQGRDPLIHREAMFGLPLPEETSALVRSRSVLFVLPRREHGLVAAKRQGAAKRSQHERRTIERVQTGVRLEKRILLVV